MNRTSRIVSAAMIGALVSGCATVIHGGTQDIRVTSNPTGAVVRVNLNNTATTTPGMITLNRKETAYVLTFEKQGYKSVEVPLKRSLGGWVFGNVLLGLYGILFGIVIDFSSGAAYKLTPAEVNTILGPMKTSLKKDKDTLIVFADLHQLPKEIQERIAHERQQKA